MNGLSVALQAATILLREGLEALLVVAALGAFLTRAGVPGGKRALAIGAIAGVLASILAAIAFEILLGGNHDDRLEAIVMLLAAALMLYMSGWLYLRQNPAAWKAELQQAATRALKTGTLMSLGLIAFLAVFREGAETVLFLHSLARTSGGWSLALIAGLAAATLALVACYFAIEQLAVRLPLRPVFIATSALLFVIGIKFIGGAIQELQEQQVVPVHNIDVPQWLINIGANPSWEAVASQAVIALLAVISTAILSRRAAAPR